MFYHVVMMQLQDADDVFLERVREYGARIRAELPYVRAYHFGKNVASRARQFEWAIVSVFDSSADHDRYQISPVHQEMKAFFAPHIADIVVCDFATGDKE